MAKISVSQGISNSLPATGRNAGLPPSNVLPKMFRWKTTALSLPFSHLRGDGRDQRFDADVLLAHRLQFLVRGGHLRLAAAIHDRHVRFRAQQPPRSPGAIDRRESAADDDHVAFDLLRPAVVEVLHEVQALDGRAFRQPVQFERPRLVRPGGQEHGVVLFRQRDDLLLADRVIQLHLDALGENRGDVFLDDLARQAELGDADANLPAEIRFALEDRHFMPVAAQFAGGGQAGRSAADDRGLLARRAEIRRQRAERLLSCRRSRLRFRWQIRTGPLMFVHW